jgi:hypothetical protein
MSEQTPDQADAIVSKALETSSEDRSTEFDPYVLEQIQELEAKGLLPQEVADEVMEANPVNALRILNATMSALLMLAERGEKYQNLQQFKEAFDDLIVLEVSFLGGSDADSGRYAELDD